MGKKHRRGRATRLDALRPDVHGTGTGVVRQGDPAAHRASAPASRNRPEVHTRLATARLSRSAAALAFGWEEVARRKVGQWGVLYATGAWGFLQGLGYLTELFGWPNELPRVVALALLAGLPEVFVVAWFHGDRGDQRVTGTELALITLLFLLGGGLFWPTSTQTTPSKAVRWSTLDRAHQVTRIHAPWSQCCRSKTAATRPRMRTSWTAFTMTSLRS